MQSSPHRQSNPDVTRWRNAVFVVFALSGLAMATWAARLPSIRDQLDVGHDVIGLVILAMSVGSIIGITQAPSIAHRIGMRAAIRVTMLVVACGLLGIALGTALGSTLVVAIALAVFGLGNGALDVVMNIDGVAVESRIGTTLLPLMHASFSLGTLVAAALGALAAFSGVSAPVHLTVIAVVVFITAFITSAAVPSDTADARRDDNTAEQSATDDRRPPLRERLAIWKSPSLLLIGLIGLGMAFAEGSANDWLALAVVDGHGQSQAMGAGIFATFVGAMFIGRVAGGPLVDRFTRVRVLQVAAVLAMVGVSLVIFTSSVPIVILGTVAWGLGTSVGFPLAISAAAEGAARPAERVGAVTMIGYGAFLVGPPGIGLLSEHVGILNALIVVLVLVVISGLAAPAARERGDDQRLP